MDTVTKKDLIDRISHQYKLPRGDVRTTVQAFLDHIIEELGKGNRLEFRDFGVFEVRIRAARNAQNPKTLERVRVPERRSVKYKPGRVLREMMEAQSIAPPPRPIGSGQPPAQSMNALPPGASPAA